MAHWKVHPTVLENLASELEEAGFKMRAAIKDRYANSLGISRRSIERFLKDHSSKKEERLSLPADFEPQKIESAVLSVGAYIAKIEQETGRRVSTAGAIKKLVKERLIPDGLKPSTVNKKLRDIRAFEKQQPAQRMRARCPNEFHRADFSGSSIFVYEKPGHVRVVLEKDRRKVRSKGEPRVWLLSLVDDYSSCLKAGYILSPGESAYCGLCMLAQLWQTRDEWGFWGRPSRGLLCDNGAMRKSRVFQVVMERLNLELPGQNPYQKRAGGRVERPFRAIKTEFEAPFSLRKGDVIPLLDVQAMLIDWLKDFNRGKHPTFSGKSKIEAWLEILKQGGPLEIKGDLMKLSFMDNPRKANIDRTVSFDGQKYMVPSILAGRKVVIWGNLNGELRVQDPENQAVYPLEVFEEIPLSTYRAFRQSEGQRMLSELRTTLDFPKPDINSFATENNVHPLRPRGQPMEVRAPFEDAGHFESIEDAIIFVSKIIGQPIALMPVHRQELICDNLVKLGLEKSAVLRFAHEFAGFLDEIRRKQENRRVSDV